MADIKRGPLVEEAAWKELQAYYNSTGSKLNMLQMFKEDVARFDKFR